jgi:hypothetical protein
MRQQRIWFHSLQNGRNVVVYFRPAINIENVAPMLEERREQVVFVVLEQFVSELATLAIRVVYFSRNLFRKCNVREVFNHDLFVLF